MDYAVSEKNNNRQQQQPQRSIFAIKDEIESRRRMRRLRNRLVQNALRMQMLGELYK